MPIYEFDCPRCQQPFEELVFKSSEPVKCPRCGSPEVVRQMSVCNSSVAGGGTSKAGSGGGCGGCSGGSCSGCHH